LESTTVALFASAAIGIYLAGHTGVPRATYFIRRIGQGRAIGVDRALVAKEIRSTLARPDLGRRQTNNIAAVGILCTLLACTRNCITALERTATIGVNLAFIAVVLSVATMVGTSAIGINETINALPIFVAERSSVTIGCCRAGTGTDLDPAAAAGTSHKSKRQHDRQNQN
jgi:hypothetical protein